MKIVIVLVVVLIVLWLIARLRAAVRTNALLNRHAKSLSAVTGVPAPVIKDELLLRQLTPGDWAIEHGLDPMTFQPVEIDLKQQAVWITLRQNESQPFPGVAALQEVLHLHKEFVTRLVQEPQKDDDALREAEILKRLDDLGSRLNSDFAVDRMRELGFDPSQRPSITSQSDCDSWQRAAVNG